MIKLTTILIIVTLTQVSAASFAQRLTFKSKQATLEQLFSEIRKQTGYNVLISAEYLNNEVKQTVNFKNAFLEDVLKQILDNRGLTFIIEDRSILIKQKQRSLIDLFKAAVAAITLQGKIVDENDQPLVGVTVKEKGTNNVVITNDNGQFSITLADEHSVVIFSYISYETQEISAEKLGKHATVKLKAAVAKLQEVVINKGYYTTTRELDPGSVSQVTAKDVAAQPVTNPLQALSGRVAGMIVTQTSGLPGAAINIQIRGQNSIAGGNNPLYVIDGVPFGAAYTSVQGTGGNVLNAGQSPFNSLNPDNIESIDVLKDANATAIYGARGANGVVLITTKKGKAGKTKFDININKGIGQVGHFMDMLSPDQYFTYRRQGIANDNLVATQTNAPDLLLWDPNAYTDWQKVHLGGKSHTTDANLNISGGDTATRFLISGSYHDENPVVPGPYDYNRGNVHINLEHNSADKKFYLLAAATFASDRNNLPGIDPVSSNLIFLAPNYPVYRSDGKFNWLGTIQNPVALQLQSYKTQTSNLTANNSLRYSPFPGLNIKANLGYTRIEINGIAAVPILAQNPAFSITGQSKFFTDLTETYIVEPQVDYTAQIAGGKLSLLAGGTLQQNKTTENFLNGTNYTSDALLNSSAGAGILTAYNNFGQYRYESLYGRLNYVWAGKYVFDANMRRDGSSRFGPDYRFGNFGSVAGALIFSEEQLVKEHLGWINYGKLRLSYGAVGNDQIADYQYLATYGPTTAYGTSSAIIPTRIANPAYRWEVNKKLDIGLDIGLWQDRLDFTFDYFRNRSGNQLVRYPLPTLTGFTSYQANLPAEVQNTGFEFSFSSVNIRTGQFKWISSFNLTVPRNKLLSFPNLAGSSYANTYVVGQPLNILQGLIYRGADATGLPLFKDTNGDGKITNTSSYNNAGGDKVIIANTYPEFYGGFKNTFTYQRWQLDLFFQFTKQTGYSTYRLYTNNTPGVMSNQDASVLSGLFKPAATGASPSLTPNAYYATSDRGVGDNSFLRLKNAALSYSFPAALLSKYHLSNLRLYLQAQNLFTVTKYKGFDPETPLYNVASLASPVVPPITMVVMGLQCSF